MLRFSANVTGDKLNVLRLCVHVTGDTSKALLGTDDKLEVLRFSDHVTDDKSKGFTLSGKGDRRQV